MCLDAQRLTFHGFRIAVVADLSMAVNAGSDRPGALSCAQLLSLQSNAETRSVLLIDLRSRQQYRHGHLAGSHSIPSGLLLSGELPDGELILISETPGEAVAVLEALHAAGYHQRLAYLAEGLAGWRARGLALEAEAEPRRSGPVGVLLPGLAGTGLLLAAATLTSLPLLGLGLLLLWGAWIEPALPAPQRRQRLV